MRISRGSATSRAEPAVSVATCAVRASRSMILRHWLSAWMWLRTSVRPEIEAPGSPSSAKWIARKCSPRMCNPEVGSRWWMSATRPAVEFSIGIIASSASPSADRGEGLLERRARHRAVCADMPARRRCGSWPPAPPDRRFACSRHHRRCPLLGQHREDRVRRSISPLKILFCTKSASCRMPSRSAEPRRRGVARVEPGDDAAEAEDVEPQSEYGENGSLRGEAESGHLGVEHPADLAVAIVLGRAEHQDDVADASGRSPRDSTPSVSALPLGR